MARQISGVVIWIDNPIYSGETPVSEKHFVELENGKKEIDKEYPTWEVDKDGNITETISTLEKTKDDFLLNSDYVIIDDDTADIIGDKYEGIDFNPHFVWCDNKYGFQRKEYKRALKILKGDSHDKNR